MFLEIRLNQFEPFLIQKPWSYSNWFIWTIVANELPVSENPKITRVFLATLSVVINHTVFPFGQGVDRQNFVAEISVTFRDTWRIAGQLAPVPAWSAPRAGSLAGRFSMLKMVSWSTHDSNVVRWSQYIILSILEWMCNTAREIEAATQPLSHSAREAGPATQPLSHSGRAADAATPASLAEWLSGWSGWSSHSGRVAEWLVQPLCRSHSATQPQPLWQSGWRSHSATQPLWAAEWLWLESHWSVSNITQT